MTVMICQISFDEVEEKMATETIYPSSDVRGYSTLCSPTDYYLASNFTDSHGALNQLTASRHEPPTVPVYIARQLQLLLYYPTMMTKKPSTTT